MRLDPEDIAAIAAEVVRQMRIAEERTLDAEYLASLPAQEVKKIQQEKMRRYKEQMKSAKR